MHITDKILYRRLRNDVKQAQAALETFKRQHGIARPKAWSAKRRYELKRAYCEKLSKKINDKITMAQALMLEGKHEAAQTLANDARLDMYPLRQQQKLLAELELEAQAEDTDV